MTSTLILMLLAAAAAAREATSPDGAWTITVPDTWEAAKNEAYDNEPTSVHAIFAGPKDESKTRSLLRVAVVEKALFVSKEGRDEFRSQCDQDIQGSKMPGVQMGITAVEVDRFADRDCYRLEGFQMSQGQDHTNFVKWYVPAGDKRFVFSFMAGTTTFGMRQAEFESIMKTLKMREGPPSKADASTDWRRVVTYGGFALAAVCAIGFVIVARKTFGAKPAPTASPGE